jgi:transcriptional regulator with XRE-family HTH domain
MMIIRSAGIELNLLRLRKTSELSQAQLAIRMQLLGSNLTRESYANIERGNRNIKVTDIIILQKVYNVDFSEFFKDINPS